MSTRGIESGRPAEVRTRRPKAKTRAAILERAYEMYVDRQLIHGDERLSSVLDSLGYTTGAGYQIWPNQAAFRLDLQVYVAERLGHASLDRLDEQRDRLGELQLDDYLLEFGDLYYDYFVKREEFYLSLRFLAMDEDRPSAITKAIQRGYAELERELEARLAGACEERDYRLRSDRSMAQFVGTVIALVEGFALRHRVGLDLPSEGPATKQHRSFSVALLALVQDHIEKV